MSWGTCYSGSNNIHAGFPALMSDGRWAANWEPGCAINNQLKKNLFETHKNIISNQKKIRASCHTA